MANLNYVNGRWVNLEKPGGQVIFVGGGTAAHPGGNGASDTYPGRRPIEPKSTIQDALDDTTAGRGDTVVILPGNVTITAALTMSKDDVTLSGVTGGSLINPAAITVGAAIDGIAVSASNVTIEDLHFPASTVTSTTSRINAGAAALTVRNNTFECGQYDEETITVPAAGDDLMVEGNRFYVTANGPDAAIEIEAAGVARLVVKDNVFQGGTDTNAWDTGAINSAVAHTDCLISGNVSTFGPAIIFSAAALGLIVGNHMGEGTLGAMLNPGSCMCSENYEADAIDQSARLFPGTVAS
jgi:hypothetical protein